MGAAMGRPAERASDAPANRGHAGTLRISRRPRSGHVRTGDCRARGRLRVHVDAPLHSTVCRMSTTCAAASGQPSRQAEPRAPPGLSEAASVSGVVISAQANYVRVKTTLPSAQASGASSEHRSTVVLCKVRALLKKVGVRVLVGDRVELQRVDWAQRRGIVHEVLPRCSQLEDPAIANVDQVLVVFAVARPQPHPLQLTRFLLTAEASALPVRVVLNKTDLCDPAELGAWERRLQSWGYDPILISVERRRGISELLRVLSGRVSVLAGPSGVGKSSLVNAIRNDFIDEIVRRDEDADHASYDDRIDRESRTNIEERVGDVSERTGMGKHTTRHVSLLNIPNGGLLADTPGLNMTSLMSIEDEQLPMLFPEIRFITCADTAGPQPAPPPPNAGEDQGGAGEPLARAPCRFKNCSHVSEPGCLVHSQRWERYDHYLYFKDEVGGLNAKKRNRSIKAPEDDQRGAGRMYKTLSGRGGSHVQVPLLSKKKHRRNSRVAQRRRLQQDVAEYLANASAPD